MIYPLKYSLHFSMFFMPPTRQVSIWLAAWLWPLSGFLPGSMQREFPGLLSEKVFLKKRSALVLQVLRVAAPVYLSPASLLPGLVGPVPGTTKLVLCRWFARKSRNFYSIKAEKNFWKK